MAATTTCIDARHVERPVYEDELNRQEYLNQNRCLTGYPDAEGITNAQMLELECDTLVPAAIQNNITGKHASRLQCKLVAEGANGPTALKANANAGDVMVIYTSFPVGARLMQQS